MDFGVTPAGCWLFIVVKVAANNLLEGQQHIWVPVKSSGVKNYFQGGKKFLGVAKLV